MSVKSTQNRIKQPKALETKLWTLKSGIGGSVAVCAPQFQLKQADKLDKIKENVELGKCFILDNK